MPDSIDCPRCHTPMEQGFVADRTYGGFVQEKWGAGEPHESFWLGLRVDPKSLLRVSTMRCPKCGLLESYANPA